MNREKRRPRMRGLRRGRGVLVRGGRGGSGTAGGLETVADVVHVVEVADRGGPSRRGRGRGGLSNVRHERPGPHSIDELMILNIEELPEGRVCKLLCIPKRCADGNHYEYYKPVPSPGFWNVSCRSQHLRDEYISDLINYGSDDSESSDEEGELQLRIPRVYQSLMETPLDQEDDVGNAGDELATHITPASGLELAYAPLMATEQPWGLLQFDWRKFPNPPPSPESRRETFSVINVGPTTPHADPYDIFIEIWDRQIMETHCLGDK
ncbi:hypothetical protein HW555_002090 [Spodoptera exigua]|uniref:Uncharacterized protein n=1 Tax=Spodoptera exigua TaxID=7107 RepID=A0A835LAG7_SPOEX|nr:hypothetical protein HW555_002090 [Spodoptera exigua]